MKEKRTFKNFQEMYRSMKKPPVEPHKAPKQEVKKKEKKDEDVQAD